MVRGSVGPVSAVHKDKKGNCLPGKGMGDLDT